MNSRNAKLLLGDSIDQLKTLPDNSIDSIVTDPPYGLSFMSKKWDYDVPSVELWKECLRVLKPGGHLLAFGGTRTYHRLAVNVEDAGFEIRDQIQWLYGSGFPKSHDISKAIDKAAGAKRDTYERPAFGRTFSDDNGSTYGTAISNEAKTEAAKQWKGWGTALKPANEPIVVARKPLEKGLTVAQNVMKHGTGSMNIDASRVAVDQATRAEWAAKANKENKETGNLIAKNTNVTDRFAKLQETSGRWPANLILDEDAAAMLDEQSGDNVSRFFYVAKASKKERGEGNSHPTVKPIKLMEYLIKLVTPTGGTVLDPFMGSGTTGVAAKQMGFEFVGIEREPEYVAISTKRIENYEAS